MHNSSRKWIIFIVIVVLLGVGVALIMGEETALAPEVSENNGTATESETTSKREQKDSDTSNNTKEDNTSQNTRTESEYPGELLAGKTTPLLVATEEGFNKVQDDGKYVLLYFYANWCPTCKAEMNDAVLPAFNELDSSNVVGFRVNYNDNNTSEFEQQLAREHGVAYQHTKVLLRPDGEQITKDPSTWTKSDYITSVNELTRD